GTKTDERTTQAEQYLDAVANRLAFTVPARTQILEGGDPAEEITRYAGSSSSSFIVMSTRGRGAIGCLVFGSVADDVVRHARVPVVLVHEEESPQPGFIPRMIVPIDGSLLAEQALPQATELARSTDATVSLVQVLDLPSDPVYTDFGNA